MKQHASRQIEQLFKFDDINKNLILKRNNGYFAFANYIIEKNPSDTQVRVTKKNPGIEHTFLRMRTAISWCVADKLHNFSVASRIRELDRQYSVLSSDIAVEQEIVKKITDLDRRDIVFNKVLEKRNALRRVEKQLTNCVNWAKYWQTKGFVSNETARP